MTQQTYSPADIVQFALSKDAVNIATAFDQLAGQKVVDAIQARKIEIAKHILGDAVPPEEESIEAEAETELEADAQAETEDETVAVEDEENQESEESHENAEQSA